MRAGLPWLLVLGAACGPADDDRAPGSLLDTGWFDTDDPLGCGGEVVGSAPAAGSSGWVVHDPLTVQVADARGLTDTTLRVLDDVGAEVPVEVVVDEASLGLVATPARALRPSTEHQLVVDSCAGTTVLTFTTSACGAPLLGGPSSLVGKTFTLDLAGATWVEPAGLAALFRANVRDPILVGVQFADAVAIDLIGTQGLADGGRISQDLDAATWSLPQADFSQAPRMRSTATRVALDVQDVPWGSEFIVKFDNEVTGTEVLEQAETLVPEVEAGSGHVGPNQMITWINFSATNKFSQYFFEAPVDENTTRVFFVNMRSWLLEPEHDERIGRVNLMIAQEDIDILQDLDPVRTPESATEEILVRSDGAVVRYREWLRKWDEKGWRIDLKALREQQGDRVFAIPSPARRGEKNWVLKTVPLVDAG